MNRHCGLSPQSPGHKGNPFSKGNGVPLSRNDSSSAMTVKAKVTLYRKSLL